MKFGVVSTALNNIIRRQLFGLNQLEEQLDLESFVYLVDQFIPNQQIIFFYLSKVEVDAD